MTLENDLAKMLDAESARLIADGIAILAAPDGTWFQYLDGRWLTMRHVGPIVRFGEGATASEAVERMETQNA